MTPWSSRECSDSKIGEVWPLAHRVEQLRPRRAGHRPGWSLHCRTRLAYTGSDLRALEDVLHGGDRRDVFHRRAEKIGAARHRDKERQDVTRETVGGWRRRPTLSQ